MKRLLLSVLVVAATLAGCGQKSTPVTEEAAAPAAPAEAPAAPTAPPTTAELQQASSNAQESAGTEAAPAGDASLERMAAMPESSQLPAGKWKVGVNYQPIVPAQSTNVEPGQVEVIEFMWFACGACYQLNERVGQFKARAPAYVKFRQEHVMWGSSHRSLAKLLYTLEALGREDLVAKAFDAIHRQRQNLVAANEAQSQTLQTAFAKANGVPEADFKREYNGFAVNTRLQRAEELTRRYRVEHTPTFIVNGKYMTDASMAGGPAELMQLLGDLAAAEKR